MMRSVTRRYQTFKNRTEAKWAEHGFFYCQFSHTYLCAYCGIQRDNLPSTGCKWSQHAAWNMKCPLVLARRAMKQAESDNKCVICMQQERDSLLLPCRHLCSCSYCGQQISQCPLCRVKIESKMQIFT
jgi:hypothetical protein